MKIYEEKEKELYSALDKLSTMSKAISDKNHDISELKLEKNQLISEKEKTEEKYQKLLREHYSLKEQLEKVAVDVNDKFNDRNKFNKKVDELNQETEELIGEINKWQM